MKLNYLAPAIEERNPVNCLKKIGIYVETKKWKTRLFFYVVSDTPSTSSQLNTFIEK